jgi:hypothetical protein
MSKVNVDKLLKQLSDAVSFQYNTDATCPGVLISKLRDGTYYSSIVRYSNSYAGGKLVVCNARESSLEASLLALSKYFLEADSRAKTPIDDLRDLVG